jgi:chromatin remodeling complex protein RSC6
MAALNPSSTLAEVIGNKPMPRTEIVKKIWDTLRKIICRIKRTGE